MGVRIVIFVLLELCVLLLTGNFSVKPLLMAAFIPFITMIAGILYCIPYKKR